MLRYLIESFMQGVAQGATGSAPSTRDGPPLLSPLPGVPRSGSPAPQQSTTPRRPSAGVSAAPVPPAVPRVAAAADLGVPDAAPEPMLPPFGGGAPVRLRDAVVAAEILGKPLALRDW